MTAQINDQVFHRKIEFSLVGIRGSGLFTPQSQRIKPVMMSTACWRGYYAHYAIDDGELFLTRFTVALSESDAEAARAGRGPELFGRPPHYDGEAWGWVYDGLRQPIAFSGGLLLGANFIEELYVHMGFHPGWKYRDVREVLFKQGRLSEDFDRSDEMEALRARASEQPLQPGPADGRARIKQWVAECFSRDYAKC